MKRGLKWTIIAAACLLICMLAGAACASGAADGPIITFESSSGDGHYWLNDDVCIRIDATDAAAVFMTSSYDDDYDALHGWREWGKENEWGARNDRIQVPGWLGSDGDYSVTVVAFWGDPAVVAGLEPGTAEVPAGVTRKESTATIQVEAKGTLAAPTVSLGGLDAESRITRGELLDVSLQFNAEGEYYTIAVYPVDEENELLENADPLRYVFYEKNRKVYLPTWEMGERNVLIVGEHSNGYLSETAEIPFTVVTGANYTAPTGPVWRLSTTTVDTGEPFDVSIFIPGWNAEEDRTIELNVMQADEIIRSAHWDSNFCTLRDVILYNDAPVTITACRFEPNGDDTVYTYGAPNPAFTVNQAVDAPTPVITGLGGTVRVGEDLTFTVGVGEGEAEEPIAGHQVTYEIRLYKDERVVATRTGTGAVTIPWADFEAERPDIEPGERLNIYVRACGRGYNAKEIRKGAVFSAQADDNFHISFAGTTEEHIRLVVQQEYTLLVQMPAETSGIKEVGIYTEGAGWGGLSYAPNEVPAAGIRTGFIGRVADNSPVIARCIMADGTVRYSNMLYVDYYNLGPLPALQMTTNLTKTDGAYHIRRGDFIRAGVGNASAYAGKGDRTEIWAAIIDKAGGEENDVVYESRLFDEANTEVGLPTWRLAVREEPYYLKLVVTTHNNVWEDSVTEVPLYVDQDAENTGVIRIQATNTEPETLEKVYIQAYAPGAQQVEIFCGTKDEYYPAVSSWKEYTHCDTIAESETTEHFWARAYYSDNTTADSNVLEIRTTAPCGNLAEALTAAIPAQATAGEPLSIRTEGRNAGAAVTPDRLKVSIRAYDGYSGREYTAFSTDEVVIPAMEDEDTYSIVSGNVYRITVTAQKRGYNPATFSKIVYASNGAAQNMPALTIDGKNTAVALENRKAYTVEITGLPAGVTAVAILEADGETWQCAYPEAGATSVSETFTPRTAQKQTEIYALYTSAAVGSGGISLPWDGCTNAVPVTLTCRHTYPMECTFWDRETYTPAGKKYHTRSGHAEKWIICSDCDEKLTFVEEITSVTEEHAFFRGTCYECGYTCPHEDIEHVSRLEEGGTAVPADKWNHKVTGTLVEYDWCPNCREAVTEENRTEVHEKEEKHRYDYWYHCPVCDYTSEMSYLVVSPVNGCQPTMTVQPGETKELSVRAESDLIKEGTPFTYQWYESVVDAVTGNREEVRLNGETGPTLTLTNLTRAMSVFVEVNDGYVSRKQDFRINIDNDFYALASGNTEVLTPLGGTPTLRINAYCRDGALTYRWYRGVYDGDGIERYLPVAGVDAPALTVTPVTGAGNYRCIVTDQYGNYEEILFSLKIDTHLTVTADGGEEISAAPGSNVTLSLTATSDADEITYTWYESVEDEYGFPTDQLMPDVTGPSFTIENLSKNRYFTVEVTDGTMTKAIFLTVSLDTQLDVYINGDSEVSAAYKMPLTLSAVATDMYGGAGITYLWYFDDQDDETGDWVTKELGSTPEIEVRPTSSHVYYCKVDNGYETNSAGVNISVYSDLQLRVEGPDDGLVPYGEQATLTMHATSLTNTFTYQWYRYSDEYGYVEIPGETGAVLVIPAVTEEMDFACTVDDGVTKFGWNGAVVRPDTELTVEPEGPVAFAVTGDPVTMTVSASSRLGAEAITYRWTRTDMMSGTTEEITGATGASLTETPAGPAVYRCDVTDGLCEAFVTFRVYDREGANYYNDANRFVAEYDEKVTMSVVAASANGAVTYRWYNKGTVVEGANGPTLTVTATETTDYYCDVFFGGDTRPYSSMRFEITIRNEILIDETHDRALWVIPQEGLTLNVSATSEQGMLTYKWYKDGIELQGETGSSLHAAYEEANRISRYTCVVSDIYGNKKQPGFICISGTPAEIHADTAVTCTEDEMYYRFVPAISAAYNVTLESEYNALILLPQSRDSLAMLDAGTTEVRLRAGQTYYIYLLKGSTLTLETPQQAEQETFSFDLKRDDRIEVPALVINGKAYEAVSLTSSNTSVLYVNGKVIRALQNGQARVTAEYEGGIAGRTFNITVTNGRMLMLPYNLREVQANAFAGDTSLQFVGLPYYLEHVGRGAFANTGSVTFYVENSQTSFDTGVFTGAGAVIICPKHSHAADYCRENGLMYFLK